MLTIVLHHGISLIIRNLFFFHHMQTLLNNNLPIVLTETISYNIPYVNIALTSPPFSTTCTASSNLNNDLVLHGCEKVMDGQDCDADQCNWVSAGQGVDSWIQLTFKRIWNIVRVDAHSRHSPLDQCSQLEFQFSDDPPVQVRIWWHY